MNKDKFNNKLNHISKLFSQAITLTQKELGTSPQGKTLLAKLKESQKRCEEQTFLVAIMALVKSGKSTFLNALLGREFLPISNVPETAAAVKIRHSEKNIEGSLFNGEKKVAEGVEGIYTYLKNLNKSMRDNPNLKTDLHLFAPIQALKSKDLGSIKFEVVDTPGFGEAEEEIKESQTLHKKNEDFIDDIGVVIYLLDYTKLKTKEESQIIDKLSSMRPDLLKQVQERLFFVVSKIDIANESQHNLPADEVIDYVYKILKKKIKNITKNKIFTISANDALLSRLILDKVATPNDVSDFANKAFGRKGKNKSLEECLEAANEFLHEDSKLPNLENDIIDFIYNNRSKILLDSLITELERLINQLRDYIITAEGTLKASEKAIKEAERKIEETKKKSTTLRDKANNYEVEIEKWIKREFSDLESSLTIYIRKKVKGFNKISTSRNQKQINEALNKENEAISKYLDTKSIPFLEEYKKKITQKQKDLLDEFNLTINKFVKDFQKILKTTLNIELSHKEIDLDKPNAKKILSKANKIIDKFINTGSGSEKVKKSKKAGSFCNRKTVYYNVTNKFKTYDVNAEQVLNFWQGEVDEMCENAITVSKRLVQNHLKTELGKAKKAFDDYANQYLLVIQQERDAKAKGGIEYVTERLDELAIYKNEILQIQEGIQNYKDYSKNI